MKTQEPDAPIVKNIGTEKVFFSKSMTIVNLYILKLLKQ